MRFVPVPLLVLAGFSLLTGCATVVPSYDIPDAPNGKPTVHSIVDRINCELEEIVDGGRPQIDNVISDFYDVQVGVELSLTVTDDGSLAPTFSALSGSTFTFATGAKFEQSRAQNFTEQLFFSLRSVRREMEALKKTGDYPAIRARCTSDPDTNLSGKLGLVEAFDLAMTAGPYKKWSATGPTGVFGGSVNFVVDKELLATGPTWKLRRFTGPGSLLTASDKNNDKLTFAFVKGPHAGKGITDFAKGEAQDFFATVTQNQIANTLSLLNIAVH